MGGAINPFTRHGKGLWRLQENIQEILVRRYVSNADRKEGKVGSYCIPVDMAHSLSICFLGLPV